MEGEGISQGGNTIEGIESHITKKKKPYAKKLDLEYKKNKLGKFEEGLRKGFEKQ